DAAHYGSKSLVADCNNSPDGAVYSITTPPLNIQAIKNLNPRISFMVGHVRKSINNNESLRRYVSNDCGKRFVQVIERTGIQLVSQKNSQNFINNFTRQATDDWIRVRYSLWEYLDPTSVLFKIEVIAGNGNPVYIDD